MLWALTYHVVWKGVGAYLTHGVPGAECHARGSLATGDVQYGISDIDLEVIVDDGQGANRATVRRRWARLTRLLPPLARLVDLAVYEREELAAARSASTLRSPEPLHLVVPPADEADLRLRPGLRSGPEGPWLELQFLWRWVLGACAGAPRRDRPYQCVKLVSDPARIWLWIEHGEDPPRRRDVLELTLELMPEEAESIERALALHADLSRPDRLADTLPFCVRTSARIAARTSADAFAGGATEVRLTGADPPRLALRADHRDGLRRLTGADPPLLPLADWRSRAWPQYPDDAFAVTDLDPSDPEAVSAAVAAGGDLGPFASLWHEDLMVLAGPGILRAVQCEAFDAVSFALARGGRSARFPDAPGLSAAHTAERALVEHRAWLGAWDEPRLAAWMRAQDRTTTPELQTIGWLLSAIRAALFHASVEAGEPELCLTMAAAAEAVGAEEEWAVYAGCRRDHVDPPQAVVMSLRERVLSLPAYAFEPAERIRA